MGSEMCIRDRLSYNATSAGGRNTVSYNSIPIDERSRIRKKISSRFKKESGGAFIEQHQESWDSSSSSSSSPPGSGSGLSSPLPKNKGSSTPTFASSPTTTTTTTTTTYCYYYEKLYSKQRVHDKIVSSTTNSTSGMKEGRKE